MSAGIPWPPEVKAEALRRYVAGESLAAIERALGVADTTVALWRNQAGLAHSTSRLECANRWPPSVRAEALQRIDDGESLAAVEVALGIDRHTLARWRAAARVPAPRSEWHRNRPHIKSERILRESALMLEGLVSSVALVDPKTLDLDAARPWVASMAKSLSELNGFIKDVNQCRNLSGLSAPPLDRPEPQAI